MIRETGGYGLVTGEGYRTSMIKSDPEAYAHRRTNIRTASPENRATSEETVFAGSLHVTYSCCIE